VISPKWFTATLLLVAFTVSAFAGGSGLNVVVVVNQNSTNSVQLGNYYCEKRGVPSQNVLRINWPGGKITWSRTDFENVLRAPLNAMLTSRGLSNQIEYVVLSMDIPYRVGDGGGVSTLGTNSTTSALFYGFKPDGCVVGCPAGFSSCTLPAGSANAYAGSEGIFRHTPPIGVGSNSWLTMMLTSSNLTQAKALVDRGVASDFTQPTQTNWLVKTSDPARNIRYATFDDALFDCRVQGSARIQRINSDSLQAQGYQLGAQFALYSFFTLPITPTLFAPGGLADSLTSYGGNIFDTYGHIHALDFLNAGATASYGTLVEPCAYLEKFPSPRNYFYQARGFTAAECYYQSLTNPYQGILVGEPLAVPFARPGNLAWVGLPAGAVLSGTTNLSLNLSAADAAHPLQQVDLFLDDRWLHTVSNIPPRRFNTISVTLNGFTTNYSVPLDATLKSVASGLAAQLNSLPFSNATAVTAVARGDRIELRGTDLNVAGTTLATSASNSIGTATLLTTHVFAGRTNFLDTPARGHREFLVVGPVVVGDYLEMTVTRTNGVITTVSVTNQTIGASLQTLMQNLLNAINSTPALTGSDGVVAEDLIVGAIGPDPAAQFNLRARTAGWKEAQIGAHLSGTFTISPALAGNLVDNLPDLQPRNHLYVTAGLTSWNLDLPFNTTTNADGWHELTAVAYEGSHVRTQTRISQGIRIQNTPFAAIFTSLLGGSNTALNATMQFQVTANTNNASMNRIELFSTGGQWGVISNLATGTFSLPATNLHFGLHPVYAIATRNDGKQYRTETKWIRIVETESPFQVQAISPVPTLAWPALAGRRYEIHSTTNIATPFTLRDAVVPTNSSGLWSETNSSSPQRFYRTLGIP